MVVLRTVQDSPAGVVRRLNVAPWRPGRTRVVLPCPQRAWKRPAGKSTASGPRLRKRGC